jgi:hypothetical protein
MNDALLRRAKQRAAREGKTLRELFEEALRRHLSDPKVPRRAYHLSWTPESGRLLPGVRIEDRDHLFDVMDGRS